MIFLALKRAEGEPPEVKIINNPQRDFTGANQTFNHSLPGVGLQGTPHQTPEGDSGLDMLEHHKIRTGPSIEPELLDLLGVVLGIKIDSPNLVPTL